LKGGFGTSPNANFIITQNGNNDCSQETNADFFFSQIYTGLPRINATGNANFLKKRYFIIMDTKHAFFFFD